MILTKAYITEVPENGNNIFKVNIPLMIDNVNEEAIFDALLAVSPGSYNDYNVGDCVFVDFEDDKYNVAIILGKLYTEVPEKNNAYGLFDQLNVTGSVVLPEDTKIGNYTPQDIFNLYQGVENGTGGGGSIDPNVLKKYVQWINTPREVEGEEVEIFADKIRIMTGEEYDELFNSDETFNEDNRFEMSIDDFVTTLMFLTSVPNVKSGKLPDTE